MKHIIKRSNKFYYKRRIPLHIAHLIDVKLINRPLSQDKKLSLQIASRYNNIFTAIDVGLKLGQDISPLISELNIRAIKQTVSAPLGVTCKSGTDVYKMYIQFQDVSDNRITKISRLISTLRVLLPNDITTVSMATLDTVKQILSTMPRRSTSKYRKLSIEELINIKVEPTERMSVETINDHLKTLNSLLKFSYERDFIAKPYAITMVKKITTAREERPALSVGSIKQLVEATTTAELQSSYRLLFLTGLRLSEVYKCSVTTVDGIRCFDLTDKSLQLKSASSYRVIPVHSSIENPEQLLQDFRSMRKEYVSRAISKEIGEGGSLYSLRHSFATELAGKGVEPHIISELIGHSHGGMTLGRYVKSLPVEMLKEAIDKLPSM